MQYVDFVKASQILCVSKSKLYKMTHNREIRFFKVGSKNVFDTKDLEEYIQNREMKPLQKNRVETKAPVVSIKLTNSLLVHDRA